MLDLTKNKIKLLKLFYDHPEESFYLQEIGRRIGKKPGVFQRTINGLEKQGFLTSEYKANARFFKANTKSGIYPELRAIVLKYEKLFKKGLTVWLFAAISMSALIAGAEEAKKEALPASAHSTTAGPGPSEREQKASGFFEGLTIENAIKMTFENNKDIRIQEKEVEAAKARIMGARSVFMPQVNAEGSYTKRASVPNATAALSGKKDYGVYVGYEDDNLLGVTVGQSVYSGGANIAELRQQQLGLKSQEETLRALKLDAEFETKRLFYGLLLAYETARIAQDLLDQSVAHYKDAKNKYKEGTTSRFNVLQSKVQVTKVMPELIHAKNSIQLTIADLNKELGRGIYSSLDISGALLYEPIDIREEAFLAQAYVHRPEMILKFLGIDISKWSIEAAKAGYRPKVDLSGEYIYRSNDYGDMFNPRHNNWDIGLSVRVPLFDGFSSRAKVLEAKAKYAQSVLSKEDTEDNTALAIRRDCLDLKQAQAIIESQKDAVDETKEALRIAIISFDNGTGTNLDVLDAQVSLAQIEQTLAEGIYDYLIAKAALQRDMGRLTEEAPNEKKN